MSANRNNSLNIKLGIILFLFIGSILGLIGYEVRQYILAKEQRENFEAVRKMQSKQIKKAYEQNLKMEADKEDTTATANDQL